MKVSRDRRPITGPHVTIDGWEIMLRPPRSLAIRGHSFARAYLKPRRQSHLARKTMADHAAFSVGFLCAICVSPLGRRPCSRPTVATIGSHKAGETSKMRSLEIVGRCAVLSAAAISLSACNVTSATVSRPRRAPYQQGKMQPSSDSCFKAAAASCGGP